MLLGKTSCKACFSVLHFNDGNLIDKEYEIFQTPEDKAQAVSALVKQYYFSDKLIPKQLILPFEIEDSAVLQEYLQVQSKHGVSIRVPRKGRLSALIIEFL